MGDASDAQVREALGTGFPKHPLHKIACIGALVASRQPEGWRVDALGAPHTGERSEAQLIRDFIEKIGQLRPQLITFNGHSFDLPVLRYRAMVNRIPAVGLQVRQYFHRYTEDALDLCDVLGSYVPGAKVKLDDVSKILGLSGKPVGIDGSRVEEMVLGGQIEEVARYCETDVLNTYRVWLVYELFRGAILAGRRKSISSSRCPAQLLARLSEAIRPARLQRANDQGPASVRPIHFCRGRTRRHLQPSQLDIRFLPQL